MDTVSGSDNNPKISIFAKNKVKKNNIKNLSDDEDTEQSNSKTSLVLSLQDILESIPKDAFSTPSEKLLSSHTEWRWRFINLNGRKLVEMSKKSPNEDRQYMDNNGKWCTYNLKKEWDQYVVESKYYYARE